MEVRGQGAPSWAGGPGLELAKLEVKRVCSSQLSTQAQDLELAGILLCSFSSSPRRMQWD